MEPEGSLPRLQLPANCPYSEPDQTSPCPLIAHPEDPSYIILPPTRVKLASPDLHFQGRTTFLNLSRLQAVRLYVWSLISGFRPIMGHSQSPFQEISGAQYREVKWPERETDGSLPSNVEVKNVWKYACISQYVRMEWYITKHQGQLYHTLLR